jgi:hypothetical protein
MLGIALQQDAQAIEDSRLTQRRNSGIRARTRARVLRVSREMVANCSRPVRLLQSMLMPRPDRNSHDLLLTPNLSRTNRRLSVTSTTCAGRPIDALWGELALGRKGTQSVLVATAKTAASGVSVTWSPVRL